MRDGRHRSSSIPADVKSGPYALHVTCGENDETATREDYIAFFVRPPRDRRQRRKTKVLAAGADRVIHRLCQSWRAHHRARRRASDETAPAHSAIPISISMIIPSSAARSMIPMPTDRASAIRPDCVPCSISRPQYHSWLGGHGSALYQYNADTHLYRLARSQGCRLRRHHR